MKSFLPIAAILLALGTPSLAQQTPQAPQAQSAPPDDTPVTLTYGELNALVQARVADALAGTAMRHLSEQIAAKHPAKTPAPTPVPTPTPAVAPAQ